MATTKTVLTDFSAAGVETAINTARTAASLETLAAWQDDLPAIPLDVMNWEEWIRTVPIPFGLVLLDDTTEEQKVAASLAVRTLTVYVVIGITSDNTFDQQAEIADTEDSTAKGVEAALEGSYWGTQTTYPKADYMGCTYVPFEEMRADREVGLVITSWRVLTDREEGEA